MKSPGKSGDGAKSGSGSVKKKKIELKAKERMTRKLNDISDKIGKLEDRDTQQPAFLALMWVLALTCFIVFSDFE